MKTYPLFLLPVFKDRIWGGTALRDVFSYDVQGENIGECWGISAHPHGQSIVRNGFYQGKLLGELWIEHHELFGEEKGDSFPLMTKIIDAKMDLSVQVHPDDDYVNNTEVGFGKTECWYVIDCVEDAEIIFGHHATTKEQFLAMMQLKQWDRLWKKRKIHPGDFFYVPSGTIHALGAGSLILETQQNSDITYRLYDYDRLDQSGSKRELHHKQAMEVINFPQEDTAIHPIVSVKDTATITTLVDTPFFSVQKWSVQKKTIFIQDKNFLLLTVLAGQGSLYTEEENYFIHKGDFILLPSGLGRFSLEGDVEIIVSYK